MLVVTRKLNEAITIGDPRSPEDPIEVTVTAISGERVRLGIAAPGEVSVDRKEIWQDKQKPAA